MIKPEWETKSEIRNENSGDDPLPRVPQNDDAISNTVVMIMQIVSLVSLGTRIADC